MYAIELYYKWNCNTKLYFLYIERIPDGMEMVKESSYCIEYIYSILDEFGLDYPEQIPFKA